MCDGFCAAQTSTGPWQLADHLRGAGTRTAQVVVGGHRAKPTADDRRVLSPLPLGFSGSDQVAVVGSACFVVGGKLV